MDENQLDTFIYSNLKDMGRGDGNARERGKKIANRKGKI